MDEKTYVTIIKHGEIAAERWLENPSEREYWKGRYFGLQFLYKELSGDIDSYSDFNGHCGVFVENGEITDVRTDMQTDFD